ncbi:MAG: trehalose-phosphatase [Pseudomonadota bacterium]
MVPQQRMALFLDVDGTLLEIQDHPDAVISNPHLTGLLERVRDCLSGALALVSGRPLCEIDRIFAPARFAAAGGHGVEIRLPGQTPRTLAPTPFPEDLRVDLKAVTDAWPGAFVETKSHGVALHYRANPAAQQALRDAAGQAVERLNNEFTLLAGKMVFELVPEAVNKGAAVRHLMDDSVFAGRQPVFIGDDVTDEAGFVAARNLGGDALRVSAPVDESAARAFLPDVPAVHRWLRELCGEKS